MLRRMSGRETVEIEGVELFLAPPVRNSPPWVGREEVLAQLLAAWSRIDDDDLPLNPRLLGRPGVGKTTLATAAAERLGLEFEQVHTGLAPLESAVRVTLTGARA